MDNVTNTVFETLESRVRGRLDSLTKPPGSLGDLEELALRFALIRHEEMPSPARKAVYVFCGDHGITEEGVSPYPQAVTQQMIRNFLAGGAAINVMSRRIDSRTIIVDAGVRGPALPGVRDRKIAEGTRNFLLEPAMTRVQAEQSIRIGRELAAEAAESYDLVGLGEMGIGNTTPAAALLCAFSGDDPSLAAGAGTGAPPEMVQRKAEVIRRALALHRPDPKDAIGVLAAVGGFEIGAIAGFILGASVLRLPVVLDGFPCCAGALAARAIKGDALATCFFGHQSAERGHQRMLEVLHAAPIINLGMRLGEGTGAAVAMGIIDTAVRLYREMATFAEAQVAEPPGRNSAAG